jgi:hypothetical protein
VLEIKSLNHLEHTLLDEHKNRNTSRRGRGRASVFHFTGVSLQRGKAPLFIDEY